MNVLHILIGSAVLGCNAVAGVGAFRPERIAVFWSWATAGQVVLGIQIATGFLISSTGSGGPGGIHLLFPVAALAVVLMVRGSRGEDHPRDVLWASWAPVAAAAVAMITGFTA
ncbi:MAG TPA: hypothetical protein VI854_03440 [Acidimicrobiia bacterium]|nr:hypothetical protein [Acidimicrobiia bacterium]